MSRGRGTRLVDRTMGVQTATSWRWHVRHTYNVSDGRDGGLGISTCMPPTPVKSRARLRVLHAAGRPGPSATVTGFAAGVHGPFRAGVVWYESRSLCGRAGCACADRLEILVRNLSCSASTRLRTLMVGVTALSVSERHARVTVLSMQCDTLEHNWS